VRRERGRGRGREGERVRGREGERVRGREGERARGREGENRENENEREVSIIEFYNRGNLPQCLLVIVEV
jgi:hypothetical protein